MRKNKSTEMYGILPEYDIPNVEIRDVVGPTEIFVTLVVGDLERIVNGLKQNGRVEFVRYSGDRNVRIRIINNEDPLTKKLGG